MTDETVSGRAHQLRSAASSVPCGAMSDVADTLETVTNQLAELIGTDDECTGYAQATASAAVEAFRSLVRVRAQLHALSDHHTGGSSGGGSAPVEHPAPTPAPRTVTGPDGSQYPPDADSPHLLPSRRGEGGETPTTGNASINGRSVGQLRSGNYDASGQRDQSVRWARERLKRCGQPVWNAHHVELKLMGRMADARAMSGEVTINNVPCGYGASWNGCHDVLERVLPAGATVTVKGTQQGGAEAFRYEYHGKGPAW